MSRKPKIVLVLQFFIQRIFLLCFLRSRGIFKRKDFKILMVLPLISLIEGNPGSVSIKFKIYLHLIAHPLTFSLFLEQM